jgi:CheY-like chemotaxis protein
LRGMESLHQTNQPCGTVLVVDDCEDNLHLTVRLLQAAGIRCVTASCGCTCIEVARGQQIDLILLDLLMPRMDGWTTLAELRRDPATRHIAVIMFTCDDSLATRERAMTEGVVDFLLRPVLRERLVACVRTHLHAVEHARAVDSVHRGLEKATRHEEQV